MRYASFEDAGWRDARGTLPPSLHPMLTGTIKLLHGFTGVAGGSGNTAAPRALALWLPPSYFHGERAYPVLYLMDGRNVFWVPDGSPSGAEWRVDETLTALAAEGLEAIAVAVDHGDDRGQEYVPWIGGARHAAFVDFLAGCVAPLIDACCRTLAGRDGRVVVGSSYGAAASLSACLARPETFGAAILFSPTTARYPQLADAVHEAAALPSPVVVAHGLDERHWCDSAPLAAAFRARGHRDGESLLALETDGGHSESVWAAQFPDAARFVLSRLRR